MLMNVECIVSRPSDTWGSARTAWIHTGIRINVHRVAAVVGCLVCVAISGTSSMHPSTPPHS